MTKGAKIVSVLMILLTILIPVFNHFANMYRQTPGLGGECFLWLIPLIVYCVNDLVHDALDAAAEDEF